MALPSPRDDAARRLLLALLTVVAVIGLGTVGYMVIEGWDFWPSLFSVM